MRKSLNAPTTFAALAMVLFSMTTPAEAGWPFGRRRAQTCEVQSPTNCSAPAVAYQAPPIQYQAAPVLQTGYAAPAAATLSAAGDASDFLNWLNDLRARHRLGPVAWDPAAEADCLINSQHQASRGLGHHWMGCHRRQNSAAGAGFPGVEAMWLASPGHASALLDPSLTRVGIAWYGAYCTFGGY